MTVSTDRVATVVIDPFRRDRVGAVTGGTTLTPNIDAVARDGVVFENGFSATNATDRSVSTIQTGADGVWAVAAGRSLARWHRSGFDEYPDVLRRRSIKQQLEHSSSVLERLEDLGYK